MRRHPLLPILLLGSVLSMIPSLSAGESRPSAEVLQPLESQGKGARVLGMGSAFASVDGCADALFSNPAGLCGMRGLEGFAHHYEGFAGLADECLHGAAPLGRFGVGAAVHVLQVGGIESRNEEGERTGTHRPRRLGAVLGWGVDMGRGAHAGAAFHGTRQSLEEGRVDAWWLDAGAQVKAGSRFRLGAAGRGIGPLTGGWRPPFLLEAGGQFQPPGEFPVLLAVSALLQPQGTQVLQLGAEESLSSGFTVRVGYRVALSRERIRGFKSFTGGFGFQAGGLRFDYALQTAGELGITHTLSLGVMAPGGPPTTAPTPTPSPTVSAPQESLPLPSPPLVPSLGSSPVSPEPAIQATEGVPEDRLRVYHQVPGWVGSSDSAAARVRELLETVQRPGAGPEVWWELGQMYELSGYPAYARRCYEKVLELSPDHSEARQKLGIR